MQKQIQSSGKRGFFSKRSVGPQVREKFTLEDMLCFQKVLEVPCIPASCPQFSTIAILMEIIVSY